MRSKWLVWLMSLVLMMGLALPVSADLIWEPQDNFYESHRDECDYVGRRYQAAGYDDQVTLYSKPNGRAKETLANGQSGTVQFTWQSEDQVWGYICYAGEDQAEGWVPMDELTLIYDDQQFQEDHASELQNVEPVKVEFTQGILYSYPGGPAGSVLEEAKEYQPFSEMFTLIYTDEDGLRWGYVGYYMGRRNSWICLDDPMNEHLGTRIVEPEPSAAQLRQLDSEPGEGNEGVPPAETTDPMLLAGGLVAAVVAVTLVLIKKLHPVKKK